MVSYATLLFPSRLRVSGFKLMRILITAGPTREYFDSVRFISNPSTGKMGYAIAEQAVRRGHEVVLVSGPVALQAPQGVTLHGVTSAAEMFDASVAAFETCQAAIMTAAVCDYRPESRLPHKLAKQDRVRSIELKPTADICWHLGSIKGDRVVIGFAMEDHDHHAHAASKLARKHCDAMVLNGIGNVGSDDAVVEILHVDTGWAAPIRGTKAAVAEHVVLLAEQLVSL